MSKIKLEDVRICFRNFAGEADQYNNAGDRNFHVVVDEAMTLQLQELGARAKFFPTREDDPDAPKTGHCKVRVKYRNRDGSKKSNPPRVVVIRANGRRELLEDELASVDFMAIESCDMILSTYEGTMMDGTPFCTLYLEKMFIKLDEDDLDLKYAEYEEVGR